MDTLPPQIPDPTPTIFTNSHHPALIPLVITAGIATSLGVMAVFSRPTPAPVFTSTQVLGVTDPSYQNPFELIEQQLESQPNNPFEALR